MSKKLDAIERDLVDRNRRANEVVRRDSRSWAVTAPVPEDAKICRWCRGRLVVLQDSAQSVYCQNLCDQTHVFDRWCTSCRRKYESGSLYGETCWECEVREREAAEAAYGIADSRPTENRFRRRDRNYRA
jgi:hypothetical protein